MEAREIHIGNLIKNKVKEIGLSDAEFGRRINTTRQNAQNIYERKSIDTLMLVDISNALSYDFFSCFQNSVKQSEFDKPQNNVRLLIDITLDDLDMKFIRNKIIDNLK